MSSPKILILDIPGCAGYKVDAAGNVYSTKYGKWRKLARWVNSNGYYTTKAGNQSLVIHRAVALAFIPNPNNHTDVNHKDGNKLNNAPENLEWCTRSYNLQHALSTGLHASPEKAVVGWNPDTGHGWFFKSQAEAARHGKFTQPNINHCLTGKRTKASGYIWEPYGRA